MAYMSSNTHRFSLEVADTELVVSATIDDNISFNPLQLFKFERSVQRKSTGHLMNSHEDYHEQLFRLQINRYTLYKT